MTHAATGVAMARPGQYLTFLLAGEEYGIAILRVREIVECGAVTRVPGTPPFIRGVVNLRGTVLPVVDLSMKFGLGETALSRWTSVVIVDAEWEGVTTTLGLMTDAMSRVLDLGPGEIEPVPSFGVPIKLDYLLGMGRAEPRFVLLLDIDRVLSPEELMALPVEEPATDRGAAPASEQAAAAGEERR
jgi:purine-binding chemotaxis protein CheW